MSTRRTRYKVGVVTVAAAALTLALSVQGAEDSLLTGTITSTNGQPLEGVVVSASVDGKPVTVSVYTQADGKYFFPALESDRYQVWAQAIGLDRAEAVADLKSGVTRQDFKMKELDDYVHQLSGYQVLDAIPEDTRAWRRGKVLFQRNCTYCHETSTGLRPRFDQHGWETMVSVMANGFSPSNNKPLTPMQQELAAFLGEMRGPNTSPLRPKVFRPTGEATLPVVYEYDVVYDGGGYATHNGSDWRYGPASSAGGTGSMHDAAVDFDGNVWFTATRGGTSRTVARVDAKTGKVTDFGVPLGDGTVARSHGIFVGADGRIYFNASPRIPYLDGTLGIVDPRTETVESIRPPDGMTLVSGWLGIDAQDYIWTASGTNKQGAALRFDPKTKTFTNFLSPTAGLTYGIAGDAHGNGWWMGVNDDIIVHGDVKTGKVTEIKLPAQPLAEFLQPGDFDEGENVPQPGIGGRQSPRRPYADLNGTALWVPNFFGNTLVRIDTVTKAVKYYPMPYSGMNPYEAMVDSKHRVWVTFQNSDEMGRFDPDTEKWTFYSFPTKGMAQRHNHMLERNGVLQFAMASGPSHRVGKMIIRSEADVKALRDRVR